MNSKINAYYEPVDTHIYMYVMQIISCISFWNFDIDWRIGVLSIFMYILYAQMELRYVVYYK